MMNLRTASELSLARLSLLTLLAGSVFARDALGQALRAEQVLVVYDSRINDSLLTAEHYAGSSKVPGGVGGKLGTRPLVRVVNLATIGGGTFASPTLSWSGFKAGLRDPVRNWLIANDTSRNIRCLVLTKGLPHRVDDHDVGGVGDNATNANTDFAAGDATYASVDSEMMLLFQNMDANEAGGAGDSFADGVIQNPFHNSLVPVNAWPNHRRTITRAFLQQLQPNPRGILWTARTPIGSTNAFMPGDMLLVARLDGPTMADVFALINRGNTTLLDLNTGAYLLDETRSQGVPDTSPSVASGELDNFDLLGFLRLGDDYERTRDLAISDGRINPSLVVYDALPSPNNYISGPGINFGIGIVESRPLRLLASEAANSFSLPPANASLALAASFNWASMGWFNTIESYNGRDFGGLGTLFNQGQVASAISAGASFGIGHVWEPFAFAVPDNEVIVSRFFLGNFSAVEAAWASVPTISWQQVFVGDPLTTVTRVQEDLTGDQLVNVDDLYRFEQQLATGVFTGLDLDRSGLPDNIDRNLLQRSTRPANGVDMYFRQR